MIESKTYNVLIVILFAALLINTPMIPVQEEVYSMKVDVNVGRRGLLIYAFQMIDLGVLKKGDKISIECSFNASANLTIVGGAITEYIVIVLPFILPPNANVLMKLDNITQFHGETIVNETLPYYLVAFSSNTSYFITGWVSISVYRQKTKSLISIFI